MVGHRIRLRGDDNLSYWLKQKKQTNKQKTRNLLAAFVGVYIFVFNDAK